MTTVTMPKAAQQILDEVATIDHLTAKVSLHDSVGVTIDITSTTGRSVSITWTSGHYHQGAATGPLGFHTTMGRPGVRFDYASAFDPNATATRRYPTITSIRRARGFIGLPI